MPARLSSTTEVRQVYRNDNGEREYLSGTAPDSRSNGRWCETRQERRENFLLHGQLSVLSFISVSVPSRVTAEARKRSRSFCQTCRSQVTAKHART